MRIEKIQLQLIPQSITLAEILFTEDISLCFNSHNKSNILLRQKHNNVI